MAKAKIKAKAKSKSKIKKVQKAQKKTKSRAEKIKARPQAPKQKTVKEAELNQVLYNRLKEAASRGKPIYFSEIAELLEINMSDEEQRKKMFEMIANISLYEHQNGRPLLSAIVIKADKSPGYGFFIMARRLGLQKTNNQSFFYEEVKKVFDYWKNKSDSG
jgi:hypothetical protein